MSTSILAGPQVTREPERIALTAIEPWLKAWGSATIGHKVLLPNARRIASEGHQPGLILLAMEDITASSAASGPPREQP